MRAVFMGFAGLLLASAPAAMAAPTYLTCAIVDDGGKALEVQITADEANSQVAVFIPQTGRSVRMPAVFTPDRVRFGDRMVTYDLSRTDLIIHRTIRMLDATDRGQCQLTTAPQRAF